jgi:hypothetical protein
MEQYYVHEVYLVVVIVHMRTVLCFAVGCSCKSCVHGCSYYSFPEWYKNKKQIRLLAGVINHYYCHDIEVNALYTTVSPVVCKIFGVEMYSENLHDAKLM